MPYSNLKELPKSVQDHLPMHAQEIYREAFNHAWEEYADSSKRRSKISREAVAHEVAWAAVKLKYEKKGEHWVSKKFALI